MDQTQIAWAWITSMRGCRFHPQNIFRYVWRPVRLGGSHRHPVSIIHFYDDFRNRREAPKRL
jgi:hypothetical protein